MTVSANEFKQALQFWASGITVVTTKSEKFGVLGMTASSFASVSVTPPQILVCINDSAITIEGIKQSRSFAVNILNAEQQQVSNQFASGDDPEKRFATIAWSEALTGSPIIDQSLVSLECNLGQLVRAGTHWVVIGEVQNIICQEGDPLVYFRSAYRQLS